MTDLTDEEAVIAAAFDAAFARERAKHLGAQIDALARYIMEHVPGEPSQDEGAVDCAIRIMRTQAEKIARLRKIEAAARALIDETPYGDGSMSPHDALAQVLGPRPRYEIVCPDGVVRGLYAGREEEAERLAREFSSRTGAPIIGERVCPGGKHTVREVRDKRGVP
jgi:hypothetical protein